MEASDHENPDGRAPEERNYDVDGSPLAPGDNVAKRPASVDDERMPLEVRPFRIVRRNNVFGGVDVGAMTIPRACCEPGKSK